MTVVGRQELEQRVTSLPGKVIFTALVPRCSLVGAARSSLVGGRSCCSGRPIVDILAANLPILRFVVAVYGRAPDDRPERPS